MPRTLFLLFVRGGFSGKTNGVAALLALMRFLFGACFLFCYGDSINNKATSNQLATATALPDTFDYA